MDMFAGRILEERVVQLETSIQTLSHGIQSLLDQHDSNLPSTLYQDSGQLVDVVRTLAASTSGTASTITSIEAPTVVHRENPDRSPVLAPTGTDYSPSIRGVPISNLAQQRIQNWINEISSETAPTVGNAPGTTTGTSLFSEPISTRFSAPSTVKQSSNLKVDLAERRLKKIKELMSEKKYEKAVPHLRRAVEQVQSSPELFTTEVKLHSLQLTLAKALIKSDPPQENAEPLLRSVLDHEESSMIEKSEAAYDLAGLLSEHGSPKLEEAKELCEFAAQIRVDTFGQEDSKTHQPIARLVELCRQLQDPDEDLWSDMLPKSSKVPPLPMSSTFHMSPQLLTGHLCSISAVAFSPDSKRLGSASTDDSIKLWDTNSGALLRTFLDRRTGINTHTVAFSPDGRRLASGATDSIIRLCDSESGMVLQEFVGHVGAILTVAFSPDGRQLASCSQSNIIKLWDAHSGAIRQDLGHHNEWVITVAFSPDSRRLASGSNDKTIKLWDAGSGALLRTLADHGFGVWAVAFSPDGKRLASGSYDKTIKLRDADSGAVLQTLVGHDIKVNTVAFSPDGKRLASGSHDKTIKLWDADSGAVLQTLVGHDREVRSVAFSPDGKRLASGSTDAAVRLWHAEPRGVQ